MIFSLQNSNLSLIKYHLIILNKKDTEKTVHRRNLDVLDTESIEKGLGVYNDGQTEGYSSLPPKFSNQHPNLLGVQIIFMKSVGAAVTKRLLNLKKH